MKNLFLEKNIVQKLIIVLAIIILFNFVSPTVCNAKSWLEDIGGVLLDPIVDFIVMIFDALLGLMQKNLMGAEDINMLTPAKAEEMVNEEQVEEAEKTFWGAVGTGLAGVGLIAVGVIITIATHGAGTGIGVKLATAGANFLMGAGAVVAIGGGAYAIYKHNEVVATYQGEFSIPNIVYSPFAIFSNSVPMFDINFFNPTTKNVKIADVEDILDGDSAYIVSNEINPNTGISYAVTGENFYVKVENNTIYSRDIEIEEQVSELYDVASKMSTLSLKIQNLNEPNYEKNKNELEPKYSRINEILHKWKENGIIKATTEGYINDVLEKMEEYARDLNINNLISTNRGNYESLFMTMENDTTGILFERFSRGLS